MTVKELIAKLQKIDGDLTVAINTPHGTMRELHFIHDKACYSGSFDPPDDHWYLKDDNVYGASEMDERMEDSDWRNNPEEMKHIKPCVWVN